MDHVFITGFIGSLFLAAGAAWPVPKDFISPAKLTKNWLFMVGNIVMLAYAVLGYLQGGLIFFIFLEIMVIAASVLMMLNTNDRVNAIALAIGGSIFVIWSVRLFDNYSVSFFIIGLSILSIGYALKTGTLRRAAALMFGSVLIALFSYLGAGWIFFWLNVFFAIFSGYYVAQRLKFLRKI